MLSLQTKICFPFEYGFYKRIGIEKLNVIGELGCGNGEFISNLQLMAPQADYYCYDNDIEILKQVVCKHPKIKFICGSVNAITENVDALILRLVLHQVDNRSQFLAEVSCKLKQGSILVIIDSYDEKFQLNPPLLKFTNKLAEHRKRFSPGQATRDLKSKVLTEVEALGFKVLDSEHYYVPSSLPSYKECFKDYMLATGDMLGIGSVEKNEVLNWYINEHSYGQIGLFMYSFIKL